MHTIRDPIFLRFGFLCGRPNHPFLFSSAVPDTVLPPFNGGDMLRTPHRSIGPTSLPTTWRNRRHHPKQSSRGTSRRRPNPTSRAKQPFWTGQPTRSVRPCQRIASHATVVCHGSATVHPPEKETNYSTCNHVTLPGWGDTTRETPCASTPQTLLPSSIIDRTVR